jgi:hypothetical protein
MLVPAFKQSDYSADFHLQALQHVPSCLIEIGITRYESEGKLEPPHRHKQAFEFQFMTAGLTAYTSRSNFPSAIPPGPRKRAPRLVSFVILLSASAVRALAVRQRRCSIAMFRSRGQDSR